MFLFSFIDKHYHRKDLFIHFCLLLHIMMRFIFPLAQDCRMLQNIPHIIKRIHGHRCDIFTYNGSSRMQTGWGGDRRAVCGEGHSIKRCILTFSPRSALNITGSTIQVIRRELFITQPLVSSPKEERAGLHLGIDGSTLPA